MHTERQMDIASMETDRQTEVAENLFPHPLETTRDKSNVTSTNNHPTFLSLVSSTLTIFFFLFFLNLLQDVSGVDVHLGIEECLLKNEENNNFSCSTDNHIEGK